MAGSITIETARLILRPMRLEDAVLLHEMFSDPEFMRAFGEGPYDIAQTGRWVQRNLDHQLEHGFGLFTMVLRESGEVIGDCGFERMTFDGEPAIELGYDIVRRLWGRGLATEAASAVATFGFETLGLDRIFSLIRVGNERSQGVARRIGMQPLRPLDRGAIPYMLFALDRGDPP